MNCKNCGAPLMGAVSCEYCKSAFPIPMGTSGPERDKLENKGSTLLNDDVIVLLKKIDYIKSSNASDTVKFQKIEVLKHQLRQIGYEI